MKSKACKRPSCRKVVKNRQSNAEYCTPRCAHNAWVEANPERCRQIFLRYINSEKGQAKRKAYEASPLAAKRRKAYYTSDAGKAVINASQRKRSRATLGRVCIGCARTDAESRWSRRPKFCAACARMGERNGWCPCGSPLWIGMENGPIRCRAKCKNSLAIHDAHG